MFQNQIGRLQTTSKSTLTNTSNHLLSAKKTKARQEKLISHPELFQQAQFIKYYISITCRLEKPRKQLHRSFLTYWCIIQGVNHWLYLTKYCIKVVRLQYFKIK